jgi:hypothetical protein
LMVHMKFLTPINNQTGKQNPISRVLLAISELKSTTANFFVLIVMIDSTGNSKMSNKMFLMLHNDMSVLVYIN